MYVYTYMYYIYIYTHICIYTHNYIIPSPNWWYLTDLPSKWRHAGRGAAEHGAAGDGAGGGTAKARQKWARGKRPPEPPSKRQKADKSWLVSGEKLSLMPKMPWKEEFQADKCPMKNLKQKYGIHRWSNMAMEPLKEQNINMIQAYSCMEDHRVRLSILCIPMISPTISYKLVQFKSHIIVK